MTFNLLHVAEMRDLYNVKAPSSVQREVLKEGSGDERQLVRSISDGDAMDWTSVAGFDHSVDNLTRFLVRHPIGQLNSMMSQYNIVMSFIS